MKYFFILGSNPTLSLAELAAVFNYADEIYLVQPNIAVLETDQKITAKVIKKIGGNNGAPDECRGKIHTKWGFFLCE